MKLFTYGTIHSFEDNDSSYRRYRMGKSPDGACFEALAAIERVLPDSIDDDDPVGGKVVVPGGNFRRVASRQ